MRMLEIEALNYEGHIKGVVLQASKSLNGWIMEFETDEGEMVVPSHDDGRPAHWAHLDKAAHYAKNMGLESIRVRD